MRGWYGVVGVECRKVMGIVVGEVGRAYHTPLSITSIHHRITPVTPQSSPSIHPSIPQGMRHERRGRLPRDYPSSSPLPLSLLPSHRLASSFLSSPHLSHFSSQAPHYPKQPHKPAPRRRRRQTEKKSGRKNYPSAPELCAPPHLALVLLLYP